MKIGDVSAWWPSIHRYLRRIKPLVDVITPLALVYFAWEAGGIYQQLADIQKSKITPTWKIEYEYDSKDKSGESYLIRVKNLGPGPAFGLQASVVPTIQVALCDRGDAGTRVLWDKFVIDYGPDFALRDQKVKRTNILDEDTIMPLKRYAIEFDKAVDGEEFSTQDYGANIRQEFVVTLRYFEKLGKGAVTKSYLAAVDQVYEVDDALGASSLRLTKEELRKAIEKIRINKTNEKNDGWAGTLVCSSKRS